VSDKITAEHITLKQAAELFKQSVRNLREHCRQDHPFHLKHVRGPGGRIFVLPDDVAHWIQRKGEDWTRKRRERIDTEL
jgi:Helix-turn-helix domain